MSDPINKYDKTVWSYKKVDDDELSNQNLEIIINFFDKNKFELNINKFFSKFDIDLDTFLETGNADINDDKKLSDDVFQSDYHHSLILGKYKLNESQDILLVLEKIFTNQENKFNENNKTFKLLRTDDGNLHFEKGTVFYNFKSGDEEIILKPTKSQKNIFYLIFLFNEIINIFFIKKQFNILFMKIKKIKNFL